jgi:branched-subunit amino acid transport protein
MMSHWLVILGVAAVTFGLRASFIVFADPHRFPHAFRQALAVVPPSVLAAIVAPGLLAPDGAIVLGLDNPRAIAGLVAIGFAIRLRTPLAAIASGMASLWLLQWGLARLA